MSQSEKQKLVKLLNNAFVPPFKKLSMSMKADIGLAFESIDEFDDITKASKVLQDIFLVKATSERGFFYYVLPIACAVPFAEIIMSGKAEGSSELGELKEKALGEAFSQLMVDYSKKLSELLGKDLNFEVELFKYCKSFDDVQNIISETSSMVAVNYDITVGDVVKGVFQQLISGDVFKDMINDIPNDSNEESNINIDENFLNIETENQQQDLADSVTVQPVQFPSFDGQTSMQVDGNKNFDLLLDIKLRLTVELGRSELPIKKVLELTRGSIIELDKVAGEPVELYANGKMIAKGEVVVIEDNFGLRITSIVSPDDRIKNL